MEVVDEFCDLMQSHASRDKVVSLACYALKLCGSTCSSGAGALLAASGRLAGARACLRMFDDAAALKNMLKYGLGQQEGPVWGSLGAASGVLTLAYLQAEKLVFLIDTGILPVSNDVDFKVKTGHKLFWSLSAFVGLIRSVHALHLSAQTLKSSQHSKCAPARFTQATLTSTKLLLDVVHAVSWLPPGWLWGSALSAQHASGAATASAVLGLVIHYNARRLAS